MLDLSPNAISVLERRYLNRNEKGEITEGGGRDVYSGGPGHCRYRSCLWR